MIASRSYWFLKTSDAIRQVKPPDGLPGILVVQTLTYSIGSGFYLTGSAIFFLTYVGLSPTQVAFGVTVGGLITLIVQVPIGIAADKLGGRPAWRLGALGLTVVYALYPLIHSVGGFLLAAGVVSTFAALANTGRGRYIGELLPSQSRVNASAYLRSALNLGLAVGATGSAFFVASHSKTVIVTVVLINSASYIIDVVLLSPRLVPVLPPQPPLAQTRATRRPLADIPFLLVSVTNGFLGIGELLLTLVLPIWVVHIIDGSRLLIPVSLLVNTLIVVTLQVRACKGCEAVVTAAQRQRWSGLATATGCLFFFATEFFRGWTLWALIVAAVVLVTIGELFSMASSWGLSYGLSSEERRGEYLAVFGLGNQLLRIVAPTFSIALACEIVPVGWLLLASMFSVVAMSSTYFVDLAVLNRSKWALQRSDN